MATEKRLIDADAFIEHYCECCGQCCDLDNCCCQTVTDILDFPTADAVEVVRCKDCRYSYTIKCGRWCDKQEQYVEDDDFCSGGGRK